jgi:hypothetical protein
MLSRQQVLVADRERRGVEQSALSGQSNHSADDYFPESSCVRVSKRIDH